MLHCKLSGAPPGVLGSVALPALPSTHLPGDPRHPWPVGVCDLEESSPELRQEVGPKEGTREKTDLYATL